MCDHLKERGLANTVLFNPLAFSPFQAKYFFSWVSEDFYFVGVLVCRGPPSPQCSVTCASHIQWLSPLPPNFLNWSWFLHFTGVMDFCTLQVLWAVLRTWSKTNLKLQSGKISVYFQALRKDGIRIIRRMIFSVLGFSMMGLCLNALLQQLSGRLLLTSRWGELATL